MSVNDFEKRVQQKMEALQLRPSAGVWTEVEKRIRKQKKRRRVIIWFLLCGIVLMGGSAWWLTGTSKKQLGSNKYSSRPVNETDEARSGNEKYPTEPTKTFPQETKKDGLEKEQIDTDEKENNLQTVSKEKDPGVSLPRSNSLRREVNAVKRPRAESDKPTGQVIWSTKDTKNNREHKISDVSDVIQKKADNAEDSVIASKVTMKDTDYKPFTDSVAIAGIKKDSISISITTEIALQKKLPGKKKKSWEWGITAKAGISYLAKGASIVDSRKNADILFAAPSGSGSGPVQYITPPEPTSGQSWAIGFNGKRELAARTGISIGMEFASFTTRQMTGALVDSTRMFANLGFSSTVGNYYRTGNQSNHTNNYYYLQLPIIFHWQLNKGGKIPLVWQNGFSVGLLAWSDGLIYNESSRSYYLDNRLLNKFQLNYESGITMKFNKQSKHPFTAGLNFHYPFTSLQKVNRDKPNQLASFGVQFGWILKK